MKYHKKVDVIKRGGGGSKNNVQWTLSVAVIYIWPSPNKFTFSYPLNGCPKSFHFLPHPWVIEHRGFCPTHGLLSIGVSVPTMGYWASGFLPHPWVIEHLGFCFNHGLLRIGSFCSPNEGTLLPLCAIHFILSLSLGMKYDYLLEVSHSLFVFLLESTYSRWMYVYLVMSIFVISHPYRNISAIQLSKYQLPQSQPFFRLSVFTFLYCIRTNQCSFDQLIFTKSNIIDSKESKIVIYI